MNPDTLPCRSCGAAYDVSALLDHCSMGWSQKRWLLFTCPSCGEASHLWVTEDHLAIGFLDGGPGPCFIEEARVWAPGLRMTAKGSDIELTLGQRRSRLPER